MQKRTVSLCCAALIGIASVPSLAAISEAEAERLGGPELTPVGAERAGNADGTIPPWEGGVSEYPAGYSVGDRLLDPYADDQPLFTITAENVDDYADKLSPGQVAMFRRYPDTYRMRIFPTRRSARLPDTEYPRVKES
ncbi:MAG: DUF1329 domain-containing protein, partial [Pseudomonadota bacterium]